MYPFKHIGPEELAALRAGGPISLVDVRSEQEVLHGIIEGALHLPLHLLPIRLGELDSHLPTVFYCRSGARSAQACAFAASHGFRHLHNLHGGIMAWAGAGHPLEMPLRHAHAAAGRHH